MSNRSYHFSLSVSDAAFTYQDLAINIDGVTPPPGFRDYIHDLPQIIELTNDTPNNMYIKWMNADEGNGPDDWNGADLVSGTSKVIHIKQNQKPIARVGAMLEAGGPVNLKISGMDYRSQFIKGEN